MQAKRLAIALVIITVAAFAQQQGIGGTGGVGGVGAIQSAQPPTFRITTGSLANGTIGVAYSQTIATAQGTAPVTFSVASGTLPNGLTLNASTGTISGTPANNAGNYSFVIQAVDSATPTPNVATAPYTIAILCTPLSIVTTSPLPTATQGTAFSFQMTAQGGIAPLSWTGSNFPTGEGIIGATGIISGTPTQVGLFTPTIVVTDSCPLTPQSVTAQFQQQVNTALAITTASPLPAATVGQPYNATVSAAGGTAPYGWSVTSGTLPAGLTLGGSTGVISGTPTIAQTVTPTIQVTDSLSATASSVFSLTVTCSALSITTAALPNGTQNAIYSFQMAAQGGAGALSWTAAGLPTGLTISSTGLISGTPTAAGSFTVTASVTDSCSTPQTVSQVYTLTIAQAIGPLTITTGTTLPPVKVGAAYSQQLQATGGVTPYTWSVTGSNTFPPGITLNNSGVVSGIATTAGTYTPTVQVADSVATTTSATFTLVTSCPTITMVSTSPLPAATQGIAYSFQFTASGGVLPLVWTLTGGSLPTGLTLSSAGLLSGTPTSTGVFSPQVKVTDACLPTGSTASGTFSLTSSANSGALTITSNATLPGGVQGTAYTTTLTAQGGTPPYTWSAPSASHPGQVDLLDYALMPLPDRNSFHMSGNAYKAFRLDGSVFWWLKGSTGNPWDMEVYDATQLYHWGTENGDSSQQAACQAAGFSSCFTDPFAYKLFVTPVPVAPRYFTLGGADVVIKSPSPNNYVRTTNCGQDAQPLINLGNIMGITHDAGVVAWGGSVGSVETIEIQYYWGIANETTVPPQSGTRERYELAQGFGQIQWDTSSWNGTGWTVNQTSTNTTKSSGGGIVPNFGCNVPNVPSSPLTPGLVKITSPQLDLVDSTGVFSGTPNKSGTYTFTAQVEDSVGNLAFQAITHTVTCTTLAISSTSPLPGAVQGSPYSFQFTASGGAPPITWSATGVPAGLTLSSTGILSGTPTATGTSTISVTATDSCGTPQHVTTSFSITVSAAIQPLTIVTTSPLPAGTEGQAYNVQMTAQGGVTPYTWAKTAGSFPAGLNMNTAGLITGTPTTTGTQTPTLQVTDSAATTASSAFSITISCPTLTVSTTSPLPAAAQGTAYSFQMSSSGGLVPVTWSGSGFPAGISISTGGLISGTPSVSGTFTPSITATDSCSPTPQAVVGTFTLQVNTNLAITTVSPLPSGTLNVAYSTTMSASGGTPPYTWAITAGALPTGLSLNASTGVISGTPSVAQTTTPTIKVTDNVAANVSKVFSITVNGQSADDSRYCGPNELPVGNVADAPAQPIQKCVYTPLSATPANVATKTVCASGCDYTTIQAALNAAVCGWTIKIKSTSDGTPTGTQNVYTGQLTIPALACTASNWVIVETDQVSGLPPEGSRISPAWAGIPSLHVACPTGSLEPECGRPPYAQPSTPGIYVPKIIASTTNQPTIKCTAGMSHWRFIGLEVTSANGVAIQNRLWPCDGVDHVIFDRILMHGGNSPNWQDRDLVDAGISLNGSTYTAVINSYIGDIHCVTNTCTDSYAIFPGGSSASTNGPQKIVNNFLEASGESCGVSGGGGQGPTGTTIPVTDNEFRRNHCFKPLFWMTRDPSYFGTSLNVKNSFEMKNTQRFLAEGNIFDQTWVGQSDQFGTLVNLGAKNQASAYSGAASSNGSGGLTWLTGSQFRSTIVSSFCATPNHCKVNFTVSGTTYNCQAQTFNSGTSITVGSCGTTSVPPSCSSCSFVAFDPGLNPGAVVSDGTVRYNYFTHGSRGLAIFAVASDGGDVGSGNYRFSIHDNVFDSIDTKWADSTGACCFWGSTFQIQNQFPNGKNEHDISIYHNTALSFQSYSTYANGNGGPTFGFGFQSSATGSVTNLKIYDNIGTVGWTGAASVCNTGQDSVLNRMLCYDSLSGVPQNTYCFDHNLFATSTQSPITGATNNPPYPAAGQSPGCGFTTNGQQFVTSFANIGFTNLNAADGGNYQLLNTSPGHNAAHDGTDLGANVNLVNTYTAGVK